MIKKGIVSYADNSNKIARVTFPELDNNLTYILPIAQHVNELKTGNVVIAIFWANNMVDGLVVAEVR